MAILLKDILIDSRFSDWSFKNPVRLVFGFEMIQQIGSAELRINDGDLYADLTVIDDDFNYADLYPSVTFNSINKNITTVCISYMENPDKSIKRIKDQIRHRSLSTSIE